MRYLPRLFAQVWRTSPRLLAASVLLRLLRAAQPPLVLYVGKLIIDEIVAQRGGGAPGLDAFLGGPLTRLAVLVALELALVMAHDLLSRAAAWVDATLGELHANTVSVELMLHAAALDLKHFESSEHQDRLERARRQAGGRTALVAQVLGQAGDAITIAALAAGLLVTAPWLVLLLLFALLPAVLAEERFNQLAYQLSRRTTQQRRELDYVRFIGASADSAKEVKLFDLGGFLTDRYRSVAHVLYVANRALGVRRALWGGVFATAGSVAYYAAYALLAWRTVAGELSGCRPGRRCGRSTHPGLPERRRTTCVRYRRNYF